MVSSRKIGKFKWEKQASEKFKAINNKHNTHSTRENAFLSLFIYLFIQIKSEAKNTGLRDQVCSTKIPIVNRYLSDTLFSDSVL